MICNIPCSICGDYSECNLYYVQNRCRSCKHYKEDVLSENCPCLHCKGFDYEHRFEDDKYESL